MKNYKELLIIDDDKIFVFLINRMLEKLGCKLPIKNMKNGYEGLDFLNARYKNKKSIPSIILLDLNMPICDGWQFLAEVETLPFVDKLTIYVTSSTVEDDEIEKVKCYKSVKTFFSKPITSDILSKIIEDNLDEI